MHRRYRLTSSTDFQRVRRSGRSHAHPLAVLIASPSEFDTPRFGIAAGRALGSAVHRNRAKRRLREALRPLIPLVSGKWDVVLIARAPLLDAEFDELSRTVRLLLERAKLIAKDQ